MGRGRHSRKQEMTPATRRNLRVRASLEVDRLFKDELGGWTNLDYRSGQLAHRLLGRLGIDERSLRLRRGVIEAYFPGLTAGAGDQASLASLMQDSGLRETQSLRSLFVDETALALQRPGALSAHAIRSAALVRAHSVMQAARERELGWLADHLRLGPDTPTTLWSRALAMPSDAFAPSQLSSRSARELDRHEREQFLLALFDAKQPGLDGAVEALRRILTQRRPPALETA